MTGAGKNTVVSSSLELKSRLYLVFGQAALAAARPQWALSSPERAAGCVAGSRVWSRPPSAAGAQEAAGLPIPSVRSGQVLDKEHSEPRQVPRLTRTVMGFLFLEF